MPKNVSGVVRDQTAKMLYLIHTRGDQRPRNPKNSNLVIDEGRGWFYSHDVVTNQADLAKALGKTEPTLSRWIDRKGEDPRAIEHSYRDKICFIYKVSREAFDLLPYKEFIETTTESKSVSWHKTVADAPIQYGRILVEPPANNMRYAGITDQEYNDEPVPVSADRPFWVEFESPIDPTHKPKPQWANWQILLFNHDVEQAGFKCFLPRLQTHSAFAVSTFPSMSRRLVLPKQPILVHRCHDIGKRFEMVFVAVQDHLAPEMIKALCTDAQGPAIDAELLELAKVLKPPLTEERAVIARAPYIVVGQI